MPDDDARRELSDADARKIARMLLRELHRPPATGPARELSAFRYQLWDADEDRIEAALVELGAIDREVTTRVQRDADLATPGSDE